MMIFKKSPVSNYCGVIY